jgi:carbohydrate kinase (thermoresistant glucokinase family)
VLKSIIVMGVSGCGKSTLGKKFADFLNLPFVEGDQFHSQANIEKMKNGIPLNDSDRAPWLFALNKNLIAKKNTGSVLACSALKQSYRDILSQGFSPDQLLWIYLDCDIKTLRKRIEKRAHFMPISLLESQIEALEVPNEAIQLDASSEINQLIAQLKLYFHEK